jgi:site-specific DNA-cytosine methylase
MYIYVGFEESASCSTLLDTLELVGYSFMQFALSPAQFGIPNERPRYYLIAIYNNSFKCNNTIQDNNVDIKGGSRGVNSLNSSRELFTKIPGQVTVETPPLSAYLSEFLTTLELEELLVPEKLLEKNASWCMDIVTATDRSTSCFTKSYSKYFKGTGSVLMIPDYTISKNENKNDKVDEKSVISLIETSESKLIELKNDNSNDNTINEKNQAVLLDINASFEQSRDISFPIKQDLTLQTIILPLNYDNNNQQINDINGQQSKDNNEQQINDDNVQQTNNVQQINDATTSISDNPLFRIAPEKRKFDMDWKDQLKGMYIYVFIYIYIYIYI